MPDMPPNDSDAQPVVPILIIGRVTTQVIQTIQWGLEEEGIPTETAKVGPEGVNAKAKQAAQMSKLNVGIAVSQTEQVAVLHHRDLPEDRPLFIEGISRFDGTALRRLGANAARLVKGNPLLFPEDYPAPIPADLPEVAGEENSLTQIVAQVVREIINQTESK